MIHRALASVLVLAACSDGSGGGGGITGDSHVATYVVPARLPPSVDLLFVVDDTTAMASHQQPLAALPAQLDQVLADAFGSYGSYHIGVTTADAASGALRTSSAFSGPFIVHDQQFAGTMHNYQGTLASAVGSVMPTTAASTAAHQPLATLAKALANHPANTGFLRPNAFLSVVLIAASDDASPDPAASYAAGLQALKADPANVFASAVQPASAPRLGGFVAALPNRAETFSIDDTDYAPALAGFTQLYKTTLGIACHEPPADVDPATPGPQYDCSFVSIEDGVEHRLPACDGDDTQPCWAFELEPALCTDPTAMARLVARGWGGPFHPEIRGQCLVN